MDDRDIAQLQQVSKLIHDICMQPIFLPSHGKHIYSAISTDVAAFTTALRNSEAVVFGKYVVNYMKGLPNRGTEVQILCNEERISFLLEYFSAQSTLTGHKLTFSTRIKIEVCFLLFEVAALLKLTRLGMAIFSCGKRDTYFCLPGERFPLFRFQVGC